MARRLVEQSCYRRPSRTAVAPLPTPVPRSVQRRWQLGLDDVCFRTLHECDHLIAFKLRHLKDFQRRVDVAQKCRPIDLTNFHPFMGGLHVSSGVVQGTASTRTEKIDQELLFPMYAVVSSMMPISSQ